MADRELEHRSPSRKFVRDLGVNVLSNLISVGIIYALGVLLGVFPRTAYFYVALGLALFTIGGAVLLVLSIFLKGRSRQIGFGLACVLTGPFGIYFLWNIWTRPEPLHVVNATIFFAYVCIPFLMGVWILLGLRWPSLDPAPFDWGNAKARPAEDDQSVAA